MSDDGKGDETTKDQNGVDGMCKTGPSESDPCIEDPPKINFWDKTEMKLRRKSGLTQNGLYYVGGLLLICVLLLFVVILMGALWPSTPHHQSFPVCKSSACLRASAQITQYMNASVEKCTDVLNWACGNWFGKNSLPAGSSKWNQKEELMKQESSRVREVLTTLPLPLHTGTIEWKLKHLYEACVELDNVNADEARPLTTIISELGGWYILRDWNLEDFDYKTILRHLHVKYGVTPYFKISVVPNPRSPGNSSIAISPAGLGLPDRSYYYLTKNDPIITAYKQLIRDVVINLSAPRDKAEKFGSDVFFYEQRIAEITPESHEMLNPVSTYDPIKVSELKFTIPTLPLQDILTALFPSAMIDDHTEVIVTSQDYLLKVSQIISSTDRATMNSYMIWTLVREYLPYLSSQYTAAIDAFNAELYGTKKALKRWEFCTKLVQKFMPLAITVKLEEQSVDNKSNEQYVNTTFTNLQKIIGKHIEKYRSEPELYSHLKKKISSLRLQIGLPNYAKAEGFLKEYYTKLIILKANLFDSYKNGVTFLKKMEERRFILDDKDKFVVQQLIEKPFSVQYVASNNAVVFPSSLLSGPFFENGYPNSVIYGRIGVELAEAMVSAILPYESAWTADMKLLSSFHLTVNESIRLARYPRHCLSEVIEKNNLSSIEKANLTSLNTLKYLSALNIAFEALQEEISDNDHIHQPSLEKYEDEALFYISQMQHMCTISTRQRQIYDGLVNHQLSENSLLKLSWMQNRFMSESLECDLPSKNQCSDIF